MSEVSDKFYALLTPKMEVLRFEFKKSKGCYVKAEKGLNFTLNLKWDGRGGTSVLEGLEFFVNDFTIEKAYQKLTGLKAYNWHVYEYISGHYFEVAEPVPAYHGTPIQEDEVRDISYMELKLLIPMMYSQKTLDLANNMNFKALSQMNFEEKYPLVRIQNCVNVVSVLIDERVLPFFEQHNSDFIIYQNLLEKLESTEDIEVNFGCNNVLLLKLYTKKLNLPEPFKLQKAKFYIEKFKEGYGYMNKVDFDTLEERLANYKF